jgi:hypothetical protein
MAAKKKIPRRLTMHHRCRRGCGSGEDPYGAPLALAQLWLAQLMLAQLMLAQLWLAQLWLAQL